MRKSRFLDRRALFASGTTAALLAAVGVSAGASPVRGGQLRMAVSGGLRSDTWTKGDGLFMQIARQGLVFDTLTEIAADGTLRGELAIDWHSTDDGTRWTFNLRKDVLFHDGTPLTSADIVASAAGFEGGKVLANGPHQVLFKLRQPEPNLPMTLTDPAYYIAAAHAPDSGIGTGLYQVTDFIPGQRLLASRVKAHYKDGAAGWFDRVELVSIPSEQVRKQAMAEHLVDAADIGGLRGLETFAIKDGAVVVSKNVGTPTITSRTRPFDNLRAAERWWHS